MFNPSPAGTTFLSQGDMEYETLELGTNAISVIGKENEVGHSDGQRRETGLVQLLKY